MLADSFVLRNRQLLVAAKRCASAKETLGGKFYLMDLMLNQYIKKMSNSDNGGCLAILMFIIYALAWVGTGVMAWNWTEPDSFGGAILFLIAWGILGYIAQIIGGLIIAGIASMMK